MALAQIAQQAEVRLESGLVRGLVRLRVERQLGYKHAKYLMRLELTESLAGFGGGKGGYWEDQGYEWYAGI